MDTTNRAERRHPSDEPREDEPSRRSPGSDPAREAVTGRPDQDQTHQTGPGTGGATEQAGRVPRHAGTHATNSAKG